MSVNISKIIKEERERHTNTLIEHAFMLYQSGMPIENEFTKEELNELLGGLKALAKKGASMVAGATKSAGQAVGNAVGNATAAAKGAAMRAGQAVGNAVGNAAQGVKQAGQAVGNAVSHGAQQVGQKVQGAANAIGDTYNKGEVEAIVKKIQSLNQEYQRLTGKSFVGKFNAVANPIPRADKKSTTSGAQVRTALAENALDEVYVLKRLAGLI